MIGSMVSGKAADRKRYAADFIASCGAKQVIYVCPRNIMWQAEQSGIQAHFFAFEDLTKTDPWLTINAMIGPQTALIMENVSRYPKITSDKVLHLQRLAMQVPHKCITDIVPFTIGIEFLYTPYSYLDRSILGFPHWYAFREGYLEQDEEGNIMSSHDHLALCRKITGVTDLGTDTILASRRTVNIATTDAEKASYKAMRDEKFAAETSPTKIITNLGDLTHAFASRMDGVVATAGGLEGKVLVLVNLDSYAKKYASKLKKAGLADRVVAASFQIASARDDIAEFDHIVYAEHPIVNSYFAMDVEAQARREATVVHVTSDIKVCQYLYAKFRGEIDAIASFTETLREVKDAAAAVAV